MRLTHLSSRFLAACLPLPQSFPYYRTRCSTYTVHRILARYSAVHHNGNTTVHVQCTPYIQWLYTSGARVPGATNSSKPYFHNDCPGSAGLANTSPCTSIKHEMIHAVLQLSWHRHNVHGFFFQTQPAQHI